MKTTDVPLISTYFCRPHRCMERGRISFLSESRAEYCRVLRIICQYVERRNIDVAIKLFQKQCTLCLCAAETRLQTFRLTQKLRELMNMSRRKNSVEYARTWIPWHCKNNGKYNLKYFLLNASDNCFVVNIRHLADYGEVGVRTTHNFDNY